MHEVSICEGIILLLEEQAVVQHFQQVETLWLEIGELAGVEVEALRFSFEVVSRGTSPREPGWKYCSHRGGAGVRIVLRVCR